MTWLDSLSSLKKLAFHAPTTQNIPQNTETAYAEPVFLKRFKWVSCSEGIGIVTDLSTSGCVGIDLVDAKGFTIRHVSVPAYDVVLAKYTQIPESRRPIQAIASQLGYN